MAMSEDELTKNIVEYYKATQNMASNQGIAAQANYNYPTLTGGGGLLGNQSQGIGIGIGGGGGLSAYHPRTEWMDQPLSPTPLTMIAMRMRWTAGMTSPFQHISVVMRRDGSYLVLIVHDDKPSFIEDEANLFPSDALIAKLKLLIG